jgi:hypothetical protein
MDSRSRWAKWRAKLIRARHGHEFTKVDTAAVALMVLGALMGLVGLILDAGAPGFGIFIIGFLIFVRHMPGGG